VPEPTVPTSETGTRHRTAERVARSLDVPVVSASEEMGVINVYAGGGKHQLQETGRLLDRSNQALQTLERYSERLSSSIASLTALEFEDVVTVRDVAVVMQRGEMVHRIADEIEVLIIELGVDARLLRLQLDELYGEIDDQLDLIVADYLPMARDAEDTLAELSRLDDDGLRDLRVVASTLHRGDLSDLDLELAPKGLRVLRRVNRLPDELSCRIANHFGEFARLQRATVAELAEVDGVNDALAQQIRERLARVTETSILDQYS
jgi:diadenylate cyclase